MTDSLLVCGRLHAPYFIFVRGEGRYSDTDLLRILELPTYYLSTQPIRLPRRLERHAILANDGPWMMVADDWYYTLWHMPSTRPAIEKIGQSYDVFACSVGDADHSFDFVYYRGGRLVRRYVVEDPDYRGGRVAEDFGEPLFGETAAFKESDEMGKVLAIAASLGIKTDYTDSDFRIYVPPKSTS